MENKWLIYEKTLDNIYHNIEIYMKMLIYYYKLIIINKENDTKYIKENYPKQNISNLDMFNEYIIETKNIGIFTLFNNIPDVIHPLEKPYYYYYSSFVSFINPTYFKKQEKDDIIILDNNIWKYKDYYYPFRYQNPAPYNKNKKYIYLNIKYFNYDKYKNYLIIAVNNINEMYIYDDNTIKQKNKKEWKIVETIENTNWVYVTILRKISKEDLLNVFNVTKTLKKNTLIYSTHSRIKNNESLTFYSLDRNKLLKDPFHVSPKHEKDEIGYIHIGKLKKDLEIVNLTCDILSNNKFDNTLTSVDELLDMKNDDLNKIYNGNINYIKYNKIPKTIFNNNMGKRLLHEILYKTSNFIKLDVYYFNYLHKYSIDEFIYSYGYYNKLNKYYNYELAFYEFNKDLIEIIKTEEIKF